MWYIPQLPQHATDGMVRNSARVYSVKSSPQSKPEMRKTRRLGISLSQVYIHVQPPPMQRCAGKRGSNFPKLTLGESEKLWRPEGVGREVGITLEECIQPSNTRGINWLYQYPIPGWQPLTQQARLQLSREKYFRKLMIVDRVTPGPRVT